MSAVTRLSIFLVVLCFLIQGIQTLRCYQCSKFDDNCHKHTTDNLKSYESDCTAGMNYCKIIEHKDGGCGFHRTCAVQCTKDDASNPKTACCTTDLCNGTHRPNPTSLTLTLAGTSMAVILMKFFS